MCKENYRLWSEVNLLEECAHWGVPKNRDACIARKAVKLQGVGE